MRQNHYRNAKSKSLSAADGGQYAASESNNDLMAANMRDGLAANTGLQKAETGWTDDAGRRGVVRGSSMLGSYAPIAMPEIRMQSGGEVLSPYEKLYGKYVVPPAPPPKSMWGFAKEIPGKAVASASNLIAPAPVLPQASAPPTVTIQSGNRPTVGVAQPDLKALRGNGMSFQTNAAMQQMNQVLAKKDGGDLRTGQGGAVPGKGKGDKIPAKYEPGEYVVSNDMLKARPELRDQLRALRKQVLAAKGMTPQQADAKAMMGTTMKAAVGKTDEEIVQPAATPAVQVTPIAAPQAANQPMTEAERNTRYGRTGDAAINAESAAKSQKYTQTATSTAVSPQPANASAQMQSVDDKFMPGTRAVMSGYGDDASRNIKEGNYGALIGNTAKATLAMPFGIAEDILRPLTLSKNSAQNLKNGATNAISTAVGGNENAAGVQLSNAPTAAAKPAVTATTPAKPVAPAVPAAVPAPAAAEAIVQGADGKQYLPGTINQADRDTSEAMTTALFGRKNSGAYDARVARLNSGTASPGDWKVPTGGGVIATTDGDNNIRKLTSAPGAMDAANQAWAMQGRGIKASRDANGGLVLSNSNAAEKMAYVDTEGKPTSDYKSTRQYAEGVDVANRMSKLADKMESDRLAKEDRDQFNRPQSKHRIAAMAQMAQTKATAKQNADANAIAQGTLDIAKNKQSQEMSQYKQQEELKTLMFSGTPEQKKAAREQWNAVYGKGDDKGRYKVHETKSTTDHLGNVIPGRVFMSDSENGSWNEIGVGGGQQTQPHPDGTKLTGKDGKSYVVKNGVPVLN